MHANSRISRRFRAVPGARVALFVLFLFYALAVLAPFIANDRPYYLDAIDRGAYERARSTLSPLAESCERAALAGDDAALKRERDAVSLQWRVLRRDTYWPDDPEGTDFAGLFGDDLARRLQSRPEQLASAVARFKTAVRALRSIDPAHPESGGIELRPRVTWPLLAALRPLDVALVLALPALVVVLFTQRKRAALALLALPIVGVLYSTISFAHFLPAPVPTAVKDGIARGDVDVHSVVFAPIAMGYAETNLAEGWRPPTWCAASTMSDDGRYTRGSRAGDHGVGSVIVRPGEPALNSPLRHVLGTDGLGRDVLARVLWGARVSLAIGIEAAILLTLVGTLIGAWAGFTGGRVDALVARIIEIVQCFPAFILVLCAVAYIDPARVPAEIAVVVVIAAVGWTSVARIVRAEALRVRELEFVLAARALGLGRGAILVRHVMPNAIGPAIVAFAFAASQGILVESSLSFLGFGVQVPVPSWGSLVGESRSLEHAWIWLAPGALVFLSVLAYNKVGEGLREALEPRAANRPEADVERTDRTTTAVSA